MSNLSVGWVQSFHNLSSDVYLEVMCTHPIAVLMKFICVIENIYIYNNNNNNKFLFRTHDT